MPTSRHARARRLLRYRTLRSFRLLDCGFEDGFDTPIFTALMVRYRLRWIEWAATEGTVYPENSVRCG